MKFNPTHTQSLSEAIVTTNLYWYSKCVWMFMYRLYIQNTVGTQHNRVNSWLYHSKYCQVFKNIPKYGGVNIYIIYIVVNSLVYVNGSQYH